MVCVKLAQHNIFTKLYSQVDSYYEIAHVNEAMESVPLILNVLHVITDDMYMHT